VVHFVTASCVTKIPAHLVHFAYRPCVYENTCPPGQSPPQTYNEGLL